MSKPPVSDDFKKQVEEYRVHPHYSKKKKSLAMVPDIDPPITKSQFHQAPSQ
jgi:hypothetical protein